MCSNVVKNGKECVQTAKTGQKVPKRANEGLREGQNGGEEGQGREKSHEWSLSPSFFVRKWSLGPPFQGKDGLRDHFLGVSDHNVNFWAILGPFGAFWGLKPQNLLSREPAKSRAGRYTDFSGARRRLQK